jgi:phage host-nuclease inhibitor protein Gam
LLEGYIEFEPDVEKRELKIRIKELGRRVEEIERERLRLEEHLRLEKDKNRRSEELIARYREKIKGMLSQIKNLEEEMDSLLK